MLTNNDLKGKLEFMSAASLKQSQAGGLRKDFESEEYNGLLPIIA